MKPLAFRPEVERELDESIAHYENEQKGIGQRFYRGYREALSQIQQNPYTGFPSDVGTRTLRIAGFPFGIVFTEFDNFVQIIAVYHFSRRPGYWITRIEDE
jgi:plasmid stabilization system protein ParE